MNLSRATAYKWWNRFQQQGLVGLAEHSRRPRISPCQTPATVVEQVIALRRQYPDWGARKLRVLLAERGFAISERTLHRCLLRQDLIPAERRRRPATQRFERAEPNELWQMDFKGPQGFNRSPAGPLSILDDHSRYLIALVRLESTRGEGVRGVLRQCFRQYGLPQQMLVDHGTPWWNMQGAGWTWLATWVLKQGVELRYSGYRHPQTQGKIERMHGALQGALYWRGERGVEPSQVWLDEFRREYNSVRPHEALGLATPVDRWQPSPRVWTECVDASYPPGAELRRLDSQGQLTHARRRWLISRAFAHELVRLQTVGTRVWVYFASVLVRELDLETGRSILRSSPGGEGGARR
jgi:transposase InsO family protein